jgi:hypothetical protein
MEINAQSWTIVRIDIVKAPLCVATTAILAVTTAATQRVDV